MSYVNSMSGTPYSQQRQQLQSPMEYASPYHNDFGGGSRYVFELMNDWFAYLVSGGWITSDVEPIIVGAD